MKPRKGAKLIICLDCTTLVVSKISPILSERQHRISSWHRRELSPPDLVRIDLRCDALDIEGRIRAREAIHARRHQDDGKGGEVALGLRQDGGGRL